MTSQSQVSLKVLGAVAVGVLVTAVALCGRADAQQAGIAVSWGQPQPRSRVGLLTTDPFAVAGATAVPKTGSDPRSSAIGKLNELRKQLRTAKSAKEKDQTKTSVREALVEYFDLDIQQRRAELDRLTKRSDDMVALLTKRAAAKDQLIDLQLKAFNYEAGGLGLFSERRTGPRIQAGVPGVGRARRMFTGPGGALGGAEGAAYEDGGMGYEGGGMGYGSTGMSDGTSGMGEIDPLTAALNRVNEAGRRFRDAESAEDESKATTELREALGEYFDPDHRKRAGRPSRWMEVDAAAEVDPLVGALNRMNKAASRLQGAESAEDESKATTELREALGEYFRIVKIDPLTDALNRVNEARRRLQGAESPEDQSKATIELAETLGEYFDGDMEFRQKELDEVKKGLRTMSDCLKRRANAKDDIVDLQLQMIVNEAEGLGFFSGSDASNTTGAARWYRTDAYGAGMEMAPKTQPAEPAFSKPSR